MLNFQAKNSLENKHCADSRHLFAERQIHFEPSLLVANPGGESGGPDSLPFPIRPIGFTTTCLKLKSFHGQDPLLLFNWLIFSMKHALHFAPNLNSGVFHIVIFRRNFSPPLAK